MLLKGDEGGAKFGGGSVTSNSRACLQKVLFADDEALVRLMMADVLREEGFQVIEVSDAAEAISILKGDAGRCGDH
jgi:PleD family two-component response regulator